MFHIQYGQVVSVPREFRKNVCGGKPSEVTLNIHRQKAFVPYINLTVVSPLSGKREFRWSKPSQVKSYIHGQVISCALFKFDFVSSPLRKNRIQRNSESNPSQVKSYIHG